MAQDSIDALVKLLSRLPGVGGRSARRMALQLLGKRESLMRPLAMQLLETAERVQECPQCGNWDESSPCRICTDAKRDGGVICVVEDVADLWAMERSHLFKGQYHVLGGTLSVMDGRKPDDLRIAPLLQRAVSEQVREIILATNATVEGQTTAHYLMDRLADCNVTITQLAQGIPLGGELDYLDEGTLGAALRQRQKV